MPAIEPAIRTIVDYDSYRPMHGVYPLFTVAQAEHLLHCKADVCFAAAFCDEITDEWLALVTAAPSAVIVLSSRHINPVGELRAALARIYAAECTAPVILRMQYNESLAEQLQIKAGADLEADGVDEQDQPEFLDEVEQMFIEPHAEMAESDAGEKNPGDTQ